MAGKSFLSRLGKQKKSYKVKQYQNNDRSQSATNGEMAGRFTSSSSSSASAGGDAPPPKKRKTEEKKEEEDEWDDLEFTQADLDDIEIQASQAYAKPSVSHKPDVAPRSGPQPSTSRGDMRPELDTSGKFIKPLMSRRSSSSNSSIGSRQGGNHSHSSGGSDHFNTSSSSHTSSLPPTSSSNYSRSSSSIHSGSSEEIPLAQRPGSVSRGISSDSLDITGLLSREQSSGLSNGSVLQENTALKLQLDKMKEEVYVKDGEIKVLRDNLTSRESELERLKSEKINQIVQQNKQQTDKEKSLQGEVNSLKTQCEFNEQEKRELGNRCRELEAQIRNLQFGPSSSQTLSQTQTSPGPRKVPVQKRESPKSSTSFPSKSTFHATEGSPQKQARAEQSVKDTATMTRSEIGRRHKLNVPSSRDMSGSQLVARLLHITPSSTGSLSERGIVGVLQTPAASTSAQTVSFDRDRETSLLSPCRRRISDVQTLMEAQEKPETSNIVSGDHFNMAVHGLTQLLQTEQSDAHVVVPCPEEQMSIADRLSSSCEFSLDHSVLILPLLNDYLSHYITMLESSTEKFTGSPSTASSSSGSFDSSVESSLGLFLKDSATYANNLENLALASLRTLHILTSCRNVRNVLLSSQSLEVSDSSDMEEQEKPSTSSTAGKGGYNRQHLPKEYLEELHILRKLVKLADPGRKGHLFNVEIVQTSLSILTVLARHSDDKQILSLVPVISEEVTHNCIECESEPTIILRCLELLRSLVRSNPIVSGLCTYASECVLLCLYRFSTNESVLAKHSCNTRLQISFQVINCLSSVVGLHSGGLRLLLESNCLCSVNVVQSLVLLLYNLLKIHEEQSDLLSHEKEKESVHHEEQSESLTTLSLRILQKGIMLLHQMYQHQNEENFTRRHESVQQQYVILILNLNRIFRSAGVEQYDNEISAIQELWDFSPDEEDYESSHDTSHDDETENEMDTG